jgi:hypothetical protein
MAQRGKHSIGTTMGELKERVIFKRGHAPLKGFFEPKRRIRSALDVDYTRRVVQGYQPPKPIKHATKPQ